MWALKSSRLGAEPSQTMTAPRAMCPLSRSLAKNDVSNDVSLSIWLWVTAGCLLYMARCQGTAVLLPDREAFVASGGLDAAARRLGGGRGGGGEPRLVLLVGDPGKRRRAVAGGGVGLALAREPAGDHLCHPLPPPRPPPEGVGGGPL